MLLAVEDVTMPLTPTAMLAYDPAADVWEERSPLPQNGSFRDPVWTGSLAIFVRGDNSSGQPDWAYDPANDRWSALPPDPLGCGSDRSAVATQTAIVQFALACSDERPASYEAAVLDLDTHEWEELSPPDVAGGRNVWVAEGGLIVNPSTASIGGGEASSPGSSPSGGVLDLETRTWAALPLPSGPDPTPGPLTEYVGTAGPWVAAAGRLYSPTAQTWHTVPPAPDPTRSASAVWTGDELLVWGGTTASFDQNVATGAAYRPPPDLGP